MRNLMSVVRGGLSGPKMAFAVVAFGIAVAAQSAEAIQVDFNTAGTFSGAGPGCVAAANVLTCGGYVVTFTGVSGSVNPPNGFSSNTTFGQVAVTGTSVLTPISSNFTLLLNQTLPSPNNGPINYTATVSGSFFADSSQAFFQFNAPLTQIITSPTTSVTYLITEGDDGTPGRANVPDPNATAGDINGRITPTDISQVPEPGSMVLLSTGVLGLARAIRRKVKA